MWAEDETYASWTFSSESYPSNKTNFSATGGACDESTFYLDGSGSTWNTSKGYAFTAVTSITLTLKIVNALPAGSEITFSADTYYNKATNAPMTGFTLTASEDGSDFSTTGLDVTSLSLSTSSATKTCVYTTQEALAAGKTIAIKYTGTGKAGSGQGYFGNIVIKGPKIIVTGTTAAPSISGYTTFAGSTTVTITNDESATGAAIYYTLNGEAPTTTTSETCFAYSAPFTIDATTTVKAIAKHADDDNASTVTTKEFTKITPLENIAALVAGGANGYVQLTNALVTYVNGTNAYIEDASGAILLMGCADDLAVGDKITGVMNVTNYTTYYNLPEIKAFTFLEANFTKTTGNTVTPTEVTLATLMADDDTYNSYLSRYVTIKGATVTSAFSGKNSTISQGDKSIVLRDQNSSATLTSTVDNIVNVTAHVAIYSTTKQIAVYTQSQIVVKTLDDNAITGINDAYELDLVADGGTSTLDLSAATATSGGTVYLTVTSATQDGSAYDLTGGVLTVTEKGTITIKAYVNADDDYKYAEKTVTVTVLGEKDDPIFDIDNQSLGCGETFTVVADTHYLTDGTVTLSSSNSSIASVSGLVVTAVAVGTATITVNAAEGTDYKAGSTTFSVTVTEPTGKSTMPVTTVFEETFAESTGGPLLTWGAAEANGTLNTDNDSWETVSGSGAGGCAKFGTGSAAGSATTPSITVNNGETYSLSFKAAPWSTEASKTITVTVTGGTINGETSATTSAMDTKEWNDFDFDIVATSTSLTVQFSCSANRFFLDEVLITKSMATTSVTLAASGYASYCSEYPLDFTTTDGYKAYYVSAATAEAVTFKPITGKIKGGQGIILYGTPSAECTLTYCESDNELADNMLVGTLAPKNIATVEGEYTNFGLSGGKFVKITSGNVPANKAYLPVKTSDIATARELAIIFDDATGIDSVTREALMNGKIYNLQGQEVKTATKGIFIVNGKKVFLK